MEYNFHKTINKVDNFAARTGRWLNSKLSKIIMTIIFTILVTFFGFLVFSSKFTKSLFGIKE